MMPATRPVLVMSAYRVAAGFAVGTALTCAIPMAVAAEPSAERRREITHMTVQDCGSCHGLRLLGGLGPALTVAALRDKPDEFLLATIRNGRPGTAMPPWAPFLSEDETRWLIDQLRTGRLLDAN